MKNCEMEAPSILASVRRFIFVAALGLLLVGLTPQPLCAQAFDRIERERAQTMLNAIKGELKKNYYDPTFRGMDVDARFKAAEEKIKQATTLGQAFGAIAQALLDLNDSHTFFQPPSRPVSVEYGWQMQAIGNECYVSAIKPGSDAEKKGLKPGDRLISIDGFKPSRRELWKMEYFYYTLSPRPGMRLVVQSPGQQPRELEVAAKVRQEKRILNLSGAGTSSGDINDYIRESEDNDRLQRHRFQKFGGVVAWKMDSFSFLPEQAEVIMNGQIAGSNALILDLRGNPGGYVVTLERMVSHFFDRELKIADLKGRKEMKPMVAKKRGAKPFEGKVIVLIDSKSASAAELFARVMQLEKRGVVLGDQSSGAVMQSRGYGMELGVNRLVLYGASITNADVIMTDGKSLEHVGVIPDEVLIPTAEDMATMRDPVLARAFQLAGVRMDSTQAGALFPIEWKR
ncbi:MAG TPA: S41 family peptidase [Pyrinomonadaceae bacterium]|nr:S41 family peptidase [Pyrinomonadaceae bacterium]